ncbi:VOC family protein [Litoreibacter janthinus]|uniref:Catechol 2,3-dioxygenase n=1 Tax=Litoreibacter janthinus TaxID=670154 RepID=A0A1I6HGM1_9RHOB|nr:VOC family protein [Litoreibacter janthinus]SFR53518.1 Catechol 2,3-dioxygenase [Litoreibacter janthinus]
MFSHVTLGTNDLKKSLSFYRPFLKAVGWELKFTEEHWAGWMPPIGDRPLFILTTPVDERPATVGNGAMVAFDCANREVVVRAYDLALSLGACDEGAPGLRPEYHPDYFGAYLRDLDGNKLCLCCHAYEHPQRASSPLTAV